MFQDSYFSPSTLTDQTDTEEKSTQSSSSSTEDDSGSTDPRTFALVQKAKDKLSKYRNPEFTEIQRVEVATDNEELASSSEADKESQSKGMHQSEHHIENIITLDVHNENGAVSKNIDINMNYVDTVDHRPNCDLSHTASIKKTQEYMPAHCSNCYNTRTK